jgi:hypothetical protein
VDTAKSAACNSLICGKIHNRIKTDAGHENQARYYFWYYSPILRSAEIDEPIENIGASGGTRTPNHLIRSQKLYPIELRMQREDCADCGGGDKADSRAALT